MFLAMGCDADLPTAKRLYKSVKDPATFKETEFSLTLVEFAKLIHTFIDQECDPVDGLLEAISEKYDPNETGRCKL